MHVKRGDSIYFVTGRSQTKTETVSKTLQDDFQIPAANMNPVIFAGDKEGQNTKIQWLEKKNIKVFYGDSDNDITAAQDVVPEGSGCYAPLTRPIDRCRWPESLAKR
jgi:acid phosphatase (class B)